MPLVRKKERRPVEAPLPGVGRRAAPSADEFGAQEGRALQEIGGGLQTLGEKGLSFAKVEKEKQRKIQHDIDTTAAGDAFLKFSEVDRNIMNENLGMVKKDAQGSPQRVRNSHLESFNELKGLLENPTQQGMFSSLANNQMDSSVKRIDSHARSQMAAYKKDTFNSMANNQVGLGASYIADPGMLEVKPEVLGQTETNIRLAVENANPGASSETIKAIEDTHISGMYVSGLTALASTDAKRAGALYAEVKDKVDPSKRAALETHFKNEDLDQRAWDTFSAITPTSNDPDELMKAVEAIPEGELGIRVGNLMRAHISDGESKKRAVKQKLADDATAAIIKAPSRIAALEIAYGLKDANDVKAAISFAHAMFPDPSKASRGAVLTDYGVYDSVLREINSGVLTTHEQVAMAAGDKVSLADLNSLRGIMTKGGTAGSINYETFGKIFNRVTKSFTEEAPELAYWAYNAILNESAKTNLPPTSWDMERIIREAFKGGGSEGEIKGNWLYDPDTKAWKAIEARKVSEWNPYLSASEEEDIKAELRGLKREVTPSTISRHAKGKSFATWIPTKDQVANYESIVTFLRSRGLVSNEKYVGLHYKYNILDIERVKGSVK